jgi:hypothetical protein
MAAAFVCLIVFRWGIYGSEEEFNRHGFEYMFISFFIVTAIWVMFTLLTKPCEKQKLREFYEKVRPSGSFWKPVSGEVRLDGCREMSTHARDNLKLAFLWWVAAIVATLGRLFGIDKLLFREPACCVFWLVVFAAGGIVAFRAVRKLTAED